MRYFKWWRIERFYTRRQSIALEHEWPWKVGSTRSTNAGHGSSWSVLFPCGIKICWAIFFHCRRASSRSHEPDMCYPLLGIFFNISTQIVYCTAFALKLNADSKYEILFQRLVYLTFWDLCRMGINYAPHNLCCQKCTITRCVQNLRDAMQKVLLPSMFWSKRLWNFPFNVQYNEWNCILYLLLRAMPAGHHLTSSNL